MRKWFLFLMIVALAGCAARQPVLYPNEYYQSVGAGQADADIQQCKWLADQYARSTPAADTVRDTAIGGGTGAAIGAVGGAVSGGVSVAEGAAVGAATGATAGLLHGLFRGSEPNPVYKNYVDQCLRDKGYQVMGWQ